MRYVMMIAVMLALMLLSLFVGSVVIAPSEVIDALLHPFQGQTSPTHYIVLSSRLPMAVTAAISGAALAVSGLMLQTSFRNPLAGPSVLGINSGASMGVAVVMLATGGTLSAGGIIVHGYTAVLLGAMAGATAVLALIMGLAGVLRSALMLLIAGIMLGYLVSSVIMVMNYFCSSADAVQSYVMWGMSSFGMVTPAMMWVFVPVAAVGFALSLLLIKPLNLLALGADYARSLGLNVRLSRNLLLLSTGVLTAVVTAFCGPISFLGLAVPHITRWVFRTDDHRTLLPAAMLTGSIVALMCSICCNLPLTGRLPLNAVTPLVGAPVVIWIMLKVRK